MHTYTIICNEQPLTQISNDAAQTHTATQDSDNNKVWHREAAAQPGFDLGEGTAVMDPEIWNRGGSRSPPLSPLPLE